jgi:hypothetical protein
MEEVIPVEKVVKEYLDRFYKHYKLPRHYPEMEELVQWCHHNLGKKYRDWTYYIGHVQDPHTSLSILDPNWCILFELRWGHLIQGLIDRT